MTDWMVRPVDAADQQPAHWPSLSAEEKQRILADHIAQGRKPGWVAFWAPLYGLTA